MSRASSFRPTQSRPGPRRTAWAGLAVAVAVALTGCSSEPTVDASIPAPSLVKAGTLTVCSDMPYAPFESVGEDGKPVGFDIDLVGLVADRLDVELDVLDTEFDDIQSGKSLNTRTCDLVISAMTITGDRARVVDFSSPYFNAAQALVVRQGSGLSSLKDLGKRSVGVQAGTTGEVYLADHAEKGTKIVPLPDAEALNKALADGRVDAAFYDSTIVAPYLATHPEFEVAAEFDTGEQYGMAVRKDGNVDLLRTVNSVLSELKQGGQYDTLYATWFGAEKS